MELSLHTENVMHHRDLFLIQFICRIGGYFLSLEMLFIFSSLANFMTETKAAFCSAHLREQTITLVRSQRKSLEDKTSSCPTVAFASDCAEGCCCSGCCCSDELFCTQFTCFMDVCAFLRVLGGTSRTPCTHQHLSATSGWTNQSAFSYGWF